MLNERNYMRTPEYKAYSGSKCLTSLIMANIIFYLFSQLLPEMYPLFEFSSDWISQPWTLLSALFMHAPFHSPEGIFHIIFNMYALYVFGSLTAPAIGGRSFLGLYLFAGAVGNLCWYVCSLNSGASLVGASGAVMGIILATAMLAPNIPMGILFFPYPIKLKTLAIVFILIELFNSIFLGSYSSIAYLAHIGGFIGGAVYMELFHRRILQWNPLAFLGLKGGRFGTASAPRPPRGWTVQDYSGKKPTAGGKVSSDELNRILDKISRSGINSLTQEEQETLNRAREQMKR